VCIRFNSQCLRLTTKYKYNKDQKKTKRVGVKVIYKRVRRSGNNRAKPDLGGIDARDESRKKNRREEKEYPEKLEEEEEEEE
jgi:hypothetical protein